MVKKDQILRKVVRTVCLDPSEPLAREYPHGDLFEQVTVPDVAPSLSSMVLTGVVGSMASAASARYSFTHAPETESDEDHDMPDYQRLKDEDMVIREEFVEDFNESIKKKDEKVEGKEAGKEHTGASGSGASGESGGESGK